MLAAALQCPVLMDVDANLGRLEAAVATLAAQSFLVAPEGLLSGYLPQPGLVDRLDQAATARAIERAGEMAVRHEVHILAGACIQADGAWRNSSFYFGPDGRRWRYDKINLAQSERGDFTPGDNLPVLEAMIEGRLVRIGVQMCREIRYPEQWRWLASQGAQVFAYLNNAIGSASGHEVWRSHVISRAAETQRFVIGANNAAPDQMCPTLIVTPEGRVVAEAVIGGTTTISARLDLEAVSDWVLSQARSDVVAVGPA